VGVRAGTAGRGARAVLTGVCIGGGRACVGWGVRWGGAHSAGMLAREAVRSTPGKRCAARFVRWVKPLSVSVGVLTRGSLSVGRSVGGSKFTTGRGIVFGCAMFCGQCSPVRKSTSSFETEVPGLTNLSATFGVTDRPSGAARAVDTPAPEAIREYFERYSPEPPCLVLDLAQVRSRYQELRAALPDARICYAVKANPTPEVVAELVRLGSAFDVASMGEIDLCLAAGAAVESISYGNTIKKDRKSTRLNSS